MRSIEYSNAMDDLDAFSLHHVRTSPVTRRSVRVGATCLGVLLLIVHAVVSSGSSDAWSWVMVIAFAVLVAPVYARIYEWTVRTQTRRIYSSGKSKGFLGWHRLTLLDNELREESEAGSQLTRYHAIEGVAETETHVFVYLTPLMAHVIPRSAVSSGELVDFVEDLKEQSQRGIG